MAFLSPPVPVTDAGSNRRCGVELEFAGLDVADCVAAIIEVYGGQEERRNAFVSQVHTDAGDFTAEIDAEVLRTEGYRSYFADLGIDLDEWIDAEVLAQGISSVVRTVVPCEVGTPPLPLADLERVEALREALRRRGARGTGSSVLYAFGLHLNPELPRLDAQTILAYLRAFLLRVEDLRRELDVDLTRRVAPYIRDVPDAYRKLVLRRDYAPDAAVLIDDYLAHNPTRNRALDLLPALASLDEERVLSHLPGDHLVKARPALHYRLPNCRVDEPDWRIAREWNAWVTVEELAADGDALRQELRS